MREAEFSGDTYFEPEDLPLNVLVEITDDDNVAIDVSGSTFVASLFNDGVKLGTFDVDMTSAASGSVYVILDDTYVDQMGVYSIWRLHETPLYKRAIVQGRFIKGPYL